MSDRPATSAPQPSAAPPGPVPEPYPRGAPRGDRNRPPVPPAPPAHPAEQPPEPPQELDPDPDTPRTFEMDGIRWIAHVSGKSAAGTGPYGLAMLVAVHFSHAEEPARPRFEALLPRGRFAHLHDDELRALLRRSIRIILPGGPETERR